MIIESSTGVSIDQISTVLSEGKLLASAVQVVMDEEFIKRNRHDWFWVGGENVPNEAGWYQVDRGKLQLNKIDALDAEKLEWHERMYVYGSGHAAVKENIPLAIYIGDEYADGRLSAIYLCGPDTLTRAALI